MIARPNFTLRISSGASMCVARETKACAQSGDHRAAHLDKEAKAREHGQAPVLDLLDLQLSECVRVVSQAQGVEGATRVEGIQVIQEALRATVGTVRLCQTHQHHLRSTHHMLSEHHLHVCKSVQLSKIALLIQ